MKVIAKKWVEDIVGSDPTSFLWAVVLPVPDFEVFLPFQWYESDNSFNSITWLSSGVVDGTPSAKVPWIASLSHDIWKESGDCEHDIESGVWVL